MGRPRTRPMDMKIMCDIWRDAEFQAMSATAQWACFRSVGLMGAAAKLGGQHFGPADFNLDPLAFEAVAHELVALGVWAWVDEHRIEACQYKNLIVLMPRYRPRIPTWLRDLVLDRDGQACRRCGTADRLEMDHVHPWSLGGETVLENLQTLCRSCNYKKGAKVE